MNLSSVREWIGYGVIIIIGILGIIDNINMFIEGHRKL